MQLAQRADNADPLDVMSERSATGQRSALFISHANPEDNTFTLWLGAKLAALGYEVWADVMKLSGGVDWQRRLEGALRDRARKVLFVGTPAGAEKQGPRNEIQIANQVGRTIDDSEFVIPLRVEPFNAPFLIAQAQYIDFQSGWVQGLRELLDTLVPFQIPRRTYDKNGIWRAIQMSHGQPVENKPETLGSNWLSISRFPNSIKFYDFASAISIPHSKVQIREATWPTVPHRRGFLTFAPIDDLKDHFGPNFPLKFVAERLTNDFITNGWEQFGIAPWEARNRFGDLARQAIERLLRGRSLQPFAMSSWDLAWWAPLNVGPTNQIGFRWDAISGSRKIQGVSEKRRLHWHYGISCPVRTRPFPHIAVVGRLIFTQDGLQPLFDTTRMHRSRRSFAKSWRNARWRDMMLAFLYWVADGKSNIHAATSSGEALVLNLPPIRFESPVRIQSESEPQTTEHDTLDEDDLDVFEQDESESYEYIAEE
jgi:hypothetical protein